VLREPLEMGYLGSLLQFSESLNEGRQLDRLLEGLIARAAELPGVDTVRILLADLNEGLLVPAAGLFPESADRSPVPIGVGFSGRVAETRQPLLIDDLEKFPLHTQALRDAGLRSAIGVPLLAGSQLLGVIHIASRQPSTFSTDMVPLLEAVAERIAFAMEAIAAEAAQAASEERFRTMFEDAPMAVCLTDLRSATFGQILLANEALATLTGRPLEQLIGSSVGDLVVPEYRDGTETSLLAMAAGGAEGYTVERPLQHASGRRLWVSTTVRAVSEGPDPSYAISYIQDITARKVAEDELSRLAYSDALTGLANRHTVVDHLGLALRQAARTGTFVGVLYLDLDNFKDINDRHGHEVGDRVLVELSRRLAPAVRAADTPGRLGGDEFVVVCPDLSTADELGVIATRLLKALTPTVHLEDSPPIGLGISMGLATGHHDIAPDELIRQADLALYEAKRLGRHRWHAYSPSLDSNVKHRAATDSLLRSAMEKSWFRLHYQPIVDLRTDSVVGVEALLRIKHPEQGLIGPAAFINRLEESELAEPIEAWVLEHACREWAGSPGAHTTSLAINVSGRLASSGRLTKTVLTALEAANVPPDKISIEMTERVTVQASEAVLADLIALTDHGVQIAIDDFGTGYSSLTYLQRFPISTVKIDRSFVSGLGHHDRDEAIVRAVSSLGSALNMTVIGEGVETIQQMNALRRAGCQYGQGYLFGRPLPELLVE